MINRSDRSRIVRTGLLISAVSVRVGQLVRQVLRTEIPGLTGLLVDDNGPEPRRRRVARTIAIEIARQGPVDDEAPTVILGRRNCGHRLGGRWKFGQSCGGRL
jgi:hypothetical protein